MLYVIQSHKFFSLARGVGGKNLEWMLEQRRSLGSNLKERDRAREAAKQHGGKPTFMKELASELFSVLSLGKELQDGDN